MSRRALLTLLLFGNVGARSGAVVADVLDEPRACNEVAFWLLKMTSHVVDEACMATVQIHCYGCTAQTPVDTDRMADDLSRTGWSVKHGETYCPTCAAARGLSTVAAAGSSGDVGAQDRSADDAAIAAAAGAGSPYRLDLDQQRSVEEILAATLRLYRRYSLLFVILALGVMAPYDLAVLAITGHGPLRAASNGDVGTLLAFALLRLSLVTPLISALHMHAVVSIGEGRRPRLGAVALRGVQVLPVVAAAEIIATAGIALGFLLLIIPGVLLALRWVVVAQAAAVEHEGWVAALNSSGRLTHERYLQVLGLLLVTGVLTFAVTGSARAIPMGSTSGVGSVTVGIAVDTVLASFSALTLAMLYFSFRSRPEIAPQSSHGKRRVGFLVFGGAVAALFAVFVFVNVIVGPTPSRFRRDSAARQQARTATIAAETYAVDSGSYEGLTLAKLQSIEPALRKEVGTTLSVAASPDSYTVTATSLATRDAFSITRRPNGVLEQTCTPANTGACPAGGVWGHLR